MNKFKTLFLLITTALLGLSCVKDLEVKIEFNQATYEVSVGDTLDLLGEVKVENTDDMPLFSTADESVAKFISDGVLFACAPGEVELTASVADKKATAQLRVNVVLAMEITLELPDSVKVASEQWAKVSAKVEPKNFNYDNLEWTFAPSDQEIGLEYKKVGDAEYEFKVASYKENAEVVVTVKDKNSEVSKSAKVALIKPEDSSSDPQDPSVEPENPTDVAAKIIRIKAQDALTENLETWGSVTAEVVTDGSGEYNYANLVWEFTPSDAEATGFEYEKVSDSEYKIRFKVYKEGANVVVKVTDKISERYAVKTISVLEKPTEGVTSIEVTPKTLNLLVGNTETLKLTCSPLNYDTSLLVWESSDEKIATVNGVKVTAVSVGTAKIKVTDTVSGLYSECEVVVSAPAETEVEVKRIVLDQARLELVAGEDSYQLKATCYDEADNIVENYAGLVWTSTKAINSNEIEYDVVEVSSQGVVTPKEAGYTRVTVAVEKNQAVKASCEVTVTPKVYKVEKLTLTPAEKTINVGDYFTLTPVSEPDMSLVTDKTITYVSSNPEVVTVSEEGAVKGISVGEAIITATAASGVTATAKVIVSAAQVSEPEVTDFEIELEVENEPIGQNISLPQFKTLDIKVSYTNGYVAKNTRWESSDPSLATVTAHEGYAVVTAVYDGMMTSDEKISVTITHYAGTQSESKTIDITRAHPERVEILGLPENNTLYLGEKFGPDFCAKVYPEQANQYVTWWGNVEIYSVANRSGVADEVGCWELNATAEEGTTSVKATVYITVIPIPVNGGVLSNSQLTIEQGKSATIEVDFDPMKPTDIQTLVRHDYNVVWSTSNASVATVENGKVTAHAVGTATISAKLSNDDVLTCEVTVKEPAPVIINVGDYYYSDGTTSADLDPSKTVVGVVFSVENPTQMGDSKLAQNHPNATHGLVVALEETANIRWQEQSTDVGNWAEAKGYGLLGDENRMCGYSNTMYLKQYNTECPEENKVLVAECAPQIALSESTSGWYLPSYAEMMMLYKYEESTRSSLISDGAIANKIIAAGGTPFSIKMKDFNMPDGMEDAPSYWTSTENGTNSPWAYRVHFLYGGANNRSKTGKSYYIARYIFAF